MKIPPQYEITPEIISLVSKIDALGLYFSSINIPILIRQKIQRVSLLKSSLFSARIEGNPLKLDNLENTSDETKKKEITNIINAQKYIEHLINVDKKITINDLLNIHQEVLKDLSPDAGKLRTEQGAIFNQAGIAIYMSPPPDKIISHLNELLSYANSHKENFPIITGLISHIIFEKIHPFIDGNGRVGRLLIGAILRSKGFESSLAVPFEEYLDENKSDYYYFLDTGLEKTNDYLAFMLHAYLVQAEKIKTELENELGKKDQLFLPPRQEEIYQIIKDHKIISFDEVKRRFLRVPERTLRYDLMKLTQKGIIVKIGETRGVYYSTKK